MSTKLAPHVVVEYPAGSGPKQDSGIAYRRLEDVESRPIDWLWKGWIAKGKPTMYAGDPGLGKSQATLDLAAAVSCGGRLPDGTRAKRGRVVIVSAEDDAADTVRPRLQAAGADLSNVFIVDGVKDGQFPDGTPAERWFSLVEDVERLSRLIDEIGGDVAMVIVDPIAAYLGRTDSHKNSEVRAVLAPLGKLAEKHGCAVVVVSHLNKAAGAVSPGSRVTGSGAFVAAVRAAYLIVRDPADESRRLFLPIKNNIGSDGTGLAFTVEGVEIESAHGPIQTSRVVWDPHAVTMTAAEALQAGMASDTTGGEGGAAVTEAAEWLSTLLSDKPLAAKTVKDEARAAGIPLPTVRRAKAKLGVKAVKVGLSGGWVWRLADEGAQGAPVPKNMSAFEDAQGFFEDAQDFGDGGKVEHLRSEEAEF